MTTRSPLNVAARARALVPAALAVVCTLTLLACHEGYDPAADEARKDAGARPDGSASTSPATAGNDAGNTKDGGASDARTSEAQPEAAATSDAAGPAASGTGASTTTDAAAAPPAGPVVAACMGHAGESVCDGATLIRCGMSANAESRTQCTSEAHCRAGVVNGRCAACAPGTAMCLNAELHECQADGELMRTRTCDSPMLCSAGDKSCTPGQCGADAYKCDGALLKKCKPDLTGFDEGTPCNSAELCNELDKRCNECVPNSKVCAEDTLMVCGADGKGPMAMPCSGSTPKCSKDKCVQCKADADCMPPGDCRVATCNVGTGTCMVANAPRGSMCSTGFCDLLGTCARCVEDGNCNDPGKFCDWGSCVDRQPLTLSLLGCSITLNAGWSLYLDGAPVASEMCTLTVRFTQLLLPQYPITKDSRSMRIITASSQATTYSVSAVTSGGASASCSAGASSDSTVNMVFASGSETMTIKLRAQKP